MSYRIAGIDVHKKMLAVAVADVEVDGDFQFDRQKVGTTPIDLRRLADWLDEHEVDEVVMESTAQYSGGRKRDFPDAERLVKRLVAQEFTLSFVPDADQRLWRTVMRRKYQVTRNRVQLQNRLEALLEEAHIKDIEPGVGPAWHQCPPHAAGASGRRNGSVRSLTGSVV
jgi:transposase